VQQLGVIIDYAQGRLEEIAGKIKEIRANPLGFIQNEQTLRKVVLLEWLDYIRPLVGTKWEHKIAKWKNGASLHTKARKQ